MELLVS